MTSKQGLEMQMAALDEKIAAEYRKWAERAPGVTPQEEGYLGGLWRAWDMAQVELAHLDVDSVMDTPLG